MRQMIWVLLVALLGAMATAQETAIEDLAAISKVEVENPVLVDEQVSQKTAQGVLEAVEAVVASLAPSNEAPAEETVTNEEQPAEAAEAETAGAETPAETAPGDVAEAGGELETETPVEALEVDVETPSSVEPEAEAEAEEVAKPLSKKELKAVSRYNTAVDQVVAIMSKQLKNVGAIPLTVDEQSLLALEVDPEPTPEPEPASTSAGGKKRKGNTNRNGAKKNKNKKNKNNNNRKNNKNNKNNKRKNRNEDDSDVEARRNNSQENDNNSGDKGNKNKNRKNKNKNNKNKKNKNKNSQNRRQPKALDDHEEASEDIEEGRRKDSPNNNAKKNKNPNNNAKKNKNNKNKGNKRNNNKSRKNKNKKSNKGRTDIEAREESGPINPTPAERTASNARLGGLTKVTRNGDVVVNLSGKREQIEAQFTIGPLSVNLKDKTRALTKSHITTTLSGVMKFKVKSVARRDKINLHSLEVMELVPEDVSVTRSDLDLDAEAIASVQQQVVDAVDTARIGRILANIINDIFAKDNIVQNLENHPFLKELTNQNN